MVVLVTCMNEEDPIKTKVLEWSQHYSLIFRCSGASNSVTSHGILTKFKLIQAFTVVLVNCKNQKDLLKNEGTSVVTTFLPLLVYGDFSKGRQLRSPISDLIEFRTHPRLYGCPCCLQE